MLALTSLDDIASLMTEAFAPAQTREEMVPLLQACGRILAQDIYATEYVPSFARSSVDGYALMAADTFGCSDSIPAILPIQAHIRMGEETHILLQKGHCASIPTGGALPEGADAIQMIEYIDDYGDNTVGILKAVAPGQHIILKGDDVHPGKRVLSAGAYLKHKDIGVLAALGICHVPVAARFKVGLIATGDELVDIDETPNNAQVRSVNCSLLTAMLTSMGLEAVPYGILKDDEALLHATLEKAAAHCDMVLISGGSSVGVKDVTSTVIATQGELLFHGIAMKPGKPTILGKVQQKPVFGLPGHPVAVFFVMLMVVQKLLAHLTGMTRHQASVQARVTESVVANDGRTQCVPAALHHDGDEIQAIPIRNKSGLITTLAGADGYFIIPQDCEGIAKNTQVTLYLF